MQVPFLAFLPLLSSGMQKGSRAFKPSADPFSLDTVQRKQVHPSFEKNGSRSWLAASALFSVPWAHTCTGQRHIPVQGWVSLEHFNAHVLFHEAVQENREGGEADVVESQIRSIVQSLREGDGI